MFLVVYMYGPDGSSHRVGHRKTTDPRPYSYANLGLEWQIRQAARLAVPKGHRVVCAVEAKPRGGRPIYAHAGPAIRYALCHAADRIETGHPECRDLYQGNFDGLALALEILLNSDDTELERGIAWSEMLPPNALDHCRRFLGPLDQSDWLLGITTEDWTSEFRTQDQPGEAPK